MKNVFSLVSPVLLGGIMLGIGLFGYTVYAQFQPPTEAPPGGNVPAPLNVGSQLQSKSGGLSLGSLQIEGGTTLNTAGGGAPACDSTIQGTLWFTKGPPDKLEICADAGGGLGWQQMWP